jgi:DNA-directed RNA polymerase specialized sigma24 family protein
VRCRWPAAGRRRSRWSGHLDGGAAIQVIADGEALLSPRLTRRLVAEFAKRPAVAVEAAHRREGVTEREREVLVLIARGLSNTEIAAELHTSIATAKSHVGHLPTNSAPATAPSSSSPPTRPAW